MLYAYTCTKFEKSVVSWEALCYCEACRPWPTPSDGFEGGGRYALHTVNDVSASSGISSPKQVINSILKQSFRWRFM